MKRWVVFAGALLAPISARASDKAECVAASESAQDLRGQSKLVEARAQLLVCARAVCPPVVAQDCAQWLKEVEVATPTLAISARDAHGNDLIAVKVLLDGKVWLTSLDGKARPVDPGPHTLAFESSAGKATQSILVREGEHDRAVSATLGGEATPAPTTQATTGSTTPPAAPATGGEQPEEAHGSWMKPVGLTIGGIGVAGIVVGSILGGLAIGKWNDAQTQCAGGCLPGSDAYASKSTAVTFADASTGLFIAGGVLAAAGLVLFIVAPSKKDTAHITVGLGGITLGGRF